MPSAKALKPANFFGGDRYAAYLDELTASGTIAGQSLSPAERKEGFKKRGDKINFEKFVNKVIEKKTGPAMGGPGKALPGGGGGAIIKSTGSAVQPFVASPVAAQTQENLDEIMQGIDSILETLRAEQKFEKKKAGDERKRRERTTRATKEDKLEKSAFTKLGEGLKKTIAPVKNIFDKLFKFLFTVLVGRVLVKFVEWFSDKENERKIKAIGRFLKDTWPVLLGAYVLFGTGFGKFVRGLFGLTKFFIVRMAKLAAKLTLMAIKNPLVAAGVLAVGAAGYGLYQQSRTPSNDPEAAPGQTQLDDTQSFGGITGDPMGGLFSSGGRVPGSGSGDTFAARLTPGEFVMSKGAVDHWGAGMLASMNAMGGGTNRPTITGGVPGYAGGGAVGMTDIQKQALGVLAKYESGAAGYNAVNQIGTKGGRGVAGFSGDIRKMPQHKGRSLTDFTIGEIKKLQYDDRTMSNQQWIAAGKLHAVGRYQFIGNTLPGVAKRAGIPDDAKFSPGVQDLMALQLMKERGISPWVGPSDKATPSERAIVAQARTQPIKYNPKVTTGEVATASSGKAWWDPLGLFSGKDDSSMASAPADAATGAAPSISSAAPRPAAGVTPPAGPPVSFADAVAALNNTADIGSEGPTPTAENVPSFDSFGSSLAKMQTLGIFEAV